MNTTKKMNHKILFVLLFTLVLLAGSVMPVSAADGPERLVDMADLLSDSEESDLLNMLNEISERQQLDIVIVTTDSLEGYTAEQYADDFYDYNGYGFGNSADGILFLISMEERDWSISTTGYGITAFTDAGQAYIIEVILSDLSDGYYASAFTRFANLCDDYITQARTGNPYDIDNMPKEPFEFGVSLAVSFIAAFVIALIATGIMRSRLKSVRSQSKADDYIRSGSMQLTRKNDLFLYRHVSRREKPKESSSGSSGSSGGSTTHRSSSGTTHGGSSGKF